MKKIAFAGSIILRRLLGQRRSCPYCLREESLLLQRKSVLLELRKCSVCKLKFRYPTDDMKSNLAFYQEAYLPLRSIPDDELLKRIIQNKVVGTNFDFSGKVSTLEQFLPKGRVLDFGCSWGYSVCQLKAKGFDAIGFDVSKPRSAFGRSALDVEIFDSFDALEQESHGAFDAIFSSHVLEHLPRLKPTLELFEKLLKPGGILLVYVPNADCKIAREQGVGWRSLIGQNHTLALNREFFDYALPLHSFTPKFATNESPLAECGFDELPVVPDHLDGEELLVVAKKNKN